VYNEEYRHTSLIATLRKTWDLGEAFTRRDASARTFDHVFALEAPRDPKSWVTVQAQPVPAWTLDIQSAGAALSTLGTAIGPGLIELAKRMGIKLPPELDGPSPEFPPELVIQFLREICLHIFPALAPSASGDE
jgi:phospholipase C